MTPDCKIAIYGSRHQEKHLRALMHLLASLADQCKPGHVALQARFRDYLVQTFGFDPTDYDTFIDRLPGADVALSIGGDGTFLRTANSIGSLSTPVFGINSGHLGLLSAASMDDADSIIPMILQGSYITEPRSLIALDSPHPITHPVMRPFALNEVAVMKRDNASMITVSVMLDGRHLADYRADGLILSTPTGSTGYNLSVGGPVIAPTAPVRIITPIAAHSLNMRPLVIPEDSEVRITVHARTSAYLLSIDGKSVSMPVDIPVTLTRAPYVVNVALCPGHNFIDTLRTKMMWGVDVNS